MIPNPVIFVHNSGDPLKEIRQRSLENITSKLKHQLVSDCDLWHERQLHLRLLEWFNFHKVPQELQVLQLILRLVQVWNEPSV